ncbi:NAD(P)/FAD-dependent oxidoreductase [Acidihalobacter ferrooxydans]|uniref:Pyridine nucleotide-disulfide oxidoreductase n=1 Tax=Acidihalobacter ferrooxydans TaxID=1765967 RepID=A0A1P8UIE8_9GAMM|nr:FAD-dependent oxidoreductase [Acidihalobacter ferrooxydans]APZ43602.1 pyridine nucleotide-disulfide oxidoreductase [Acidihalobacter ferrooxydans]
MNRITVIGAGFGALTAARELRRHDRAAEITLIAPRAELIYLPSLIWIPAGLRKAEDLRIDLHAFFTTHRIQHVAARATGLENGGRRVLIDSGAPIDNDGLIIASGSRFIKKLPGIEHAITLCEGIEAAERIRDRLAAMDGGTIALGFGTNPKEPQSVRGGPMFELLFGLDALLRRQGRRDAFKLTFFNGSDRPGARLGEKAVDGLLAEMAKRGIETRLGAKPIRFETDKVVTEAGEFPADLILFMPGMTGPDWAAESGLTLSPGGMIQADAHTRVADVERVYVAGDSGSFPGPDWMPKQAHMADLQAETAAKNLLDELDGRTPSHTFKTELVCIIDTLENGILVYRDTKHTVITPATRLLHWAKRAFEHNYLQRYRKPKPV